MTQQVFLSTGVDEETLLLRGRRESFRLSDERVYVYLRLNNVPVGEHEIRYDYYSGAGELLGHYDHTFKVENRSWIAWSWWDFRPNQDAPDVWTIDIRFDGNLIGSVEVLVEA